MDNYLAKYKPETSVFKHFDVDQNLPEEEKAFATWKALLLAKRSYEGLFLVIFYGINNLCHINKKSSFALFVKRSLSGTAGKLNSALGHVRIHHKKQGLFLQIKNTIQLLAQRVKSCLLHITTELDTVLGDVEDLGNPHGIRGKNI